MKIQYMLVCEFAREGRNGLVDFLGVLDRVWVKQIPAAHPMVTVVALAVAENEDDLGEQPIHLVLTTPSGQPVFEQQGKAQFQALHGTWLSSIRLILQLANLPLTEFGRYRFRLQVGKGQADHPVDVVEGAPPRS